MHSGMVMCTALAKELPEVLHVPADCPIAPERLFKFNWLYPEGSGDVCGGLFLHQHDPGLLQAFCCSSLRRNKAATHRPSGIDDML